MTTSDVSRPPGRRRLLRPGTVIPLMLAVWLVLEVWLLGVVARAAGVLTVALLLLAGLVLGGALIRRAGRRAWRRFAEAVRDTGAPPERSSGSGPVMASGFLLMLPGFASDALALLLLLPPVRAALRKSLERYAAARVGAARGGGGPLDQMFQQARVRRPGGGKVVQGEVINRDGPAGHEQERQNAPAPRPNLTGGHPGDDADGAHPRR